MHLSWCLFLLKNNSFSGFSHKLRLISINFSDFDDLLWKEGVFTILGNYRRSSLRAKKQKIMNDETERSEHIEGKETQTRFCSNTAHTSYNAMQQVNLPLGLSCVLTT